MFDDPKVSLPDWFTVSSRPLGGVAPDRLHTPEQGGRLDARAAEEEVFIVDDRSAMSAAQMVENKLTRITQGRLVTREPSADAKPVEVPLNT